VFSSDSKVCATGALKTMTRVEIKGLVNDLGLSFHDNVTTTTTHLVIADPSSNSSKAKKARSQGCILLSEEDFLRDAYAWSLPSGNGVARSVHNQVGAYCEKYKEETGVDPSRIITPNGVMNKLKEHFEAEAKEKAEAKVKQEKRDKMKLPKFGGTFRMRL